MTPHKQTSYFYNNKTKLYHSCFDVVLGVSIHVHNCVENALKHVLFYLHDIKVMEDKIGFPMRNLLENTLLYAIMGPNKTKNLLFTRLKIIYYVTILRRQMIQISPYYSGSTISLSTPPTKDPFIFFCTRDLLAKT